MRGCVLQISSGSFAGSKHPDIVDVTRRFWNSFSRGARLELRREEVHKLQITSTMPAGGTKHLFAREVTSSDSVIREELGIELLRRSS